MLLHLGRSQSQDSVRAIVIVFAAILDGGTLLLDSCYSDTLRPVLDIVRRHDHVALAGALGVPTTLHLVVGLLGVRLSRSFPRVLTDQLLRLRVLRRCIYATIGVVSVDLVVIFSLLLSVVGLRLSGSLVVEGERGRKRLRGHHLDEDLLGILEPFEERLVRHLKVCIVLHTERHHLHFLL